MVSAHIRIDGTQRLRANLRRIAGNVPRRLLDPAQRELAIWGQRYARSHQGFQNRTWSAHRSIQPEQSRNAPGTGRFESGWALTAGGVTAPYFRFLERGTVYITPRRTIARTFRAMRARAQSVLARHVLSRFDYTVRSVVR